MREVTSHKVNGLNEALTVEAVDEPGNGGANHRYLVTGGDPEKRSIKNFVHCEIRFQNGPITEAGVNGLSNEALLAVVEDRLKCFQAGTYACRENAIALTKIQEATHWLHSRTRERMARGVEGTSAK